ncbi:MAG: hypothetical protein ACRDU0_12770, partial [Mycobacterium sp.]
PYEGLDVAVGVRHLQMLGVRYYMAVSPAAKAMADADPDLRLLAKSGPWPVTVGSQRVNQTWSVYLVADSAQVTPLVEQPVVSQNGDKNAKSWLATSLAWYRNPSVQDVALAADGPANWRRVSAAEGVPRTPVTPAVVSHIDTSGSDAISFEVDRIGSPVLVKTSYFPNWQASGAKGPWRVAPNLMVVIPTSRRVSLHYGYTPVDFIGWIATAAGLVGLAVLFLRGRDRSGSPHGHSRRRAKGGQVTRVDTEPAGGLVPVGAPTWPDLEDTPHSRLGKPCLPWTRSSRPTT